ncbi:superoxide dismutase family protein [Winogradskyella sp. 3972H.M.0a.05]|uniref:superoxide dismutase family protein n=1 Tax=Winogradskyella sp. 3972H.M.0a.05 TaxID=2950277 RepID=UPI00339914CD
MKKISTLIMVLCLISFYSCKKDKKEDATDVKTEEVVDVKEEDTNKTSQPATYSDEVKKLRIALDSKSGSTATGNVVIKQDKGVVSMIAVMSGLSEGEHAIHIHEKADCSSDDGKSTGGHWNPTGQPHGKWGDAKGYHKGDIGNFVADANGNGTIDFKTQEWCIGCGDPAKDILGKAIIVHQGADDFTSQPSGAAGSRVSCGGIIE